MTRAQETISPSVAVASVRATGAVPIAPTTCVAEREAAAFASHGRRPAAGKMSAEVADAATPLVAGSPGSPLESVARGRLEQALGADFSRVRVHDDPKAHRFAASIGAQAATLGSRIYFNEGRYAPSTEAGRRLLGHELVHALQPESRIALHRTPETEARLHEIEDRLKTMVISEEDLVELRRERDRLLKQSNRPGEAVNSSQPSLEMAKYGEVATEPLYIDNFTSASYDVFRRELHLLFESGLEVPISLGEVDKGSPPTVNSRAQQQMEKMQKSGDLTLPTSTINGGKPGGITAITVRSPDEFYREIRTGVVRPKNLHAAVTPRLHQAIKDLDPDTQDLLFKAASAFISGGPPMPEGTEFIFLLPIFARGGLGLRQALSRSAEGKALSAGEVGIITSTLAKSPRMPAKEAARPVGASATRAPRTNGPETTASGKGGESVKPGVPPSSELGGPPSSGPPRPPGPVRKPPIPDEIPRTLTEELTMSEAKSGHGTIIQGEMGDAPRLDAHYGKGRWVKLEQNHVITISSSVVLMKDGRTQVIDEGMKAQIERIKKQVGQDPKVKGPTPAQVSVHWFRNLDSGLNVEYKFVIRDPRGGGVYGRNPGITPPVAQRPTDYSPF